MTLGRLGRPHGLDGEMMLDMVALEPEELLRLRDFSWHSPRGETRNLAMVSALAGTPGGRLRVRFEGIGSREAAAPLVNGWIGVERDRLPDPGPGAAWSFQLLGCEVREEDGRVLGKLEEIIKSGAHPIYVVRGEREWMIPAIESVVKRVDLAAGVITVVLIPGLEDL